MKSAEMMMCQYVSFMRMMQLWFHGAHHLVHGESFAGDHVEIYGKIYQTIEDQIDGVIEKAVGLFGDECACPVKVTMMAAKMMSAYPSPIEMNASGVAAVGLHIEKDFLSFSQEIYDGLKSMDAMTLGLDDMIMATANAHETHVYLLQQRIKATISIRK